ncbi:MAG: hypothetical protein AB1742_00560 [bacterium]
MKRFIPLAALALSFISLHTGFPQQMEKTYNFILPMKPLKAGTEDGPDASIMVKRICGILENKLNAAISCKVLFRPDSLLLTKEGIEKYIAMIEDENYDFIYIFSDDFVRLRKHGYGKIVPLVTFTFDGKKTDDKCLFFRATDGVKTLTDLKGKRWGGSFYYWFTPSILAAHGVNEPMGEFFRLVYEPVGVFTSEADMLVENKIDVFTSTTLEHKFLQGADDRYKDIRKGFCIEGTTNHIIGCRKDFEPHAVKSVLDLLLKAHKDKDFQEYRFFFLALNGHFVKFKEEDLAPTVKLVDAADSNGWTREEIAFIRKHGGK